MPDFIISSFFEDNSGPLTGLTPTVRIWEVTTTGETLIVGTTCGGSPASDGIMIELKDCGSPETEQDGFYRYTFTEALGYDPSKAYVLRVDGGVALSGGIRYQTGSIKPTDSTDGIADSVWNANAQNYQLGSPETMGGIVNGTYDSVEIIRTNDIPAIFELLDITRKYNTNRTKIDTVAKTLTVYDDDCTTVLRVFKLYDSTGTASVEEVCERVPIGGLGSPLIGPDGLPVCE